MGCRLSLLNNTQSLFFDYCITKNEQREVALVTISRCLFMRWFR